ncbi:MAG: hypothetical protein ACRECE_13825, partial [Xanthobacteraceae bacterium]
PHPCPFCTIHCHAALIIAPSVAIVQSFVALSAQTALAPFIVPAPPRFSISAPPRGPPASA